MELGFDKPFEVFLVHAVAQVKVGRNLIHASFCCRRIPTSGLKYDRFIVEYYYVGAVQFYVGRVVYRGNLGVWCGKFSFCNHYLFLLRGDLCTNAVGFVAVP